MNLFLEGLYFDGQTPNSTLVFILLKTDYIVFSDKDPYAINREQVFIKDIEDVGFSSSGELQLKFGPFPFQTIVIKDKAHIVRFKEAFPSLFLNRIYSGILEGNAFKTISLSVITLISVIALYLLVIAPFLAEKTMNLIPKTAEIALGNHMSEPIFNSLDIDESKSKILTNFFNDVGFTSEYPIELFVVDKPIVNAFAIPGGKIVVYQGIIDRIDSWEQLAGLLAHELAHVEQRHSLIGMSRKLSTYLAISILTNDASGIAAVIGENALMVKSLSNSRSMEKEADMVGLSYLNQLSVNPNGMVNLFHKLHDNSDDDETLDKIFKVMSTHPLTKNRIEYLQKEIEILPKQDYKSQPNLERLLKKLKRITNGNTF